METEIYLVIGSKLKTVFSSNRGENDSNYKGVTLKSEGYCRD